MLYFIFPQFSVTLNGHLCYILTTTSPVRPGSNLQQSFFNATFQSFEGMKATLEVLKLTAMALFKWGFFSIIWKTFLKWLHKLSWKILLLSCLDCHFNFMARAAKLILLRLYKLLSRLQCSFSLIMCYSNGLQVRWYLQCTFKYFL